MASTPLKSNDAKVHPIADIFPMMSEDAFQALKEDIRVNGQREPIVYWKNMLIDGRNRLRACEELGIEVDSAEVDDCDSEPIIEGFSGFSTPFDSVAYVLSHNLHRRHLTASQRADVAAKLATLKHGDVASQKSDGQICPSSINAVATLLNVSPSSVKSAKKVQAKGSDEVNAAVAQGKLPVSLAAKLVKAVPDKSEQSKILGHGADWVKQAVAANEWEDVDDHEPDSTPKKKKGTDAVTEYENLLSGSMQFAHLAILQLERIQPKDKDRDAAFQLVASWLNRNASGGNHHE